MTEEKNKPSSDANSAIDQAKDGFDLIEYPCEFKFKAMCKVTDGVDLPHELTQLALVHVQETALLATRSNSSRTGKFESVTLTIKLSSREELEAIYQSIADSPWVVMTL